MKDRPAAVSRTQETCKPGEQSARWSSRSTWWAERGLHWGGLVAAGVIVAPLIINLTTLLFHRHPFIGFSDNIAADAEAVATGHLQYGNPATQYTGFPYSPFYTWLVAGFLKVYWWVGWAPLVSSLAGLASIVLIIRLLWGARKSARYRLAAASFVVAIALGSLAALPLGGSYPGGPFFSYSGLEEGRPDELAWFFLVAAATTVFHALLKGRPMTLRQMLAVGLLLAASVGTKQTTIVPDIVVALIVLVAPKLLGEERRAGIRGVVRSATTLITFIGALAILGVALQLASHGFALDEMVTGQLRYKRIVTLVHQTSLSLRLLTVPLIIVVALCVGLVVSYRRQPGYYGRKEFLVGICAVIVGLSPIPSAILAEAKLGGEANQLIGPIWTLSITAAVLLMIVRRPVQQLAASAIALAILLAGIEPVSAAFPGKLGAPDLHETVSWRGPIDPFLLAAVDKGPVYDENVPSLSVTERNGDYPASDIHDALAAGYTPRLFIDDLLAGRYSLVTPFANQWIPGYISNDGEYDGTVFEKLNLLLDLGYTPVKDPSSHQIFYRPTSALKNLGWFAGCFGPYHAGTGIEVRQEGIGDLVCLQGGALKVGDPYPDNDFVSWPTTTFVTTLPIDRGELQLRFSARPTYLRVIPLNARGQVTGRVSDVAKPRSAVARCLVTQGGSATLTLGTVNEKGAERCILRNGLPFLEIPSGVSSTVYALIKVANAQEPALAALSSTGRPMPLSLLDPTPAELGGA